MGKRKLSILQIAGICLILGSLFLLLFFQLQSHWAQAAAARTAAQIQSLLPEKTQGVPGIYSDPAMPVLQVDGRDYAALLEVPAYGVTLPVIGSWDSGKLSHCPHRFWGSVYDNSLVIGGADQDGQLDFCEKVDIGDYILVTDMTGAAFTYTVDRVDRSDCADAAWLLSRDHDLTLFVRSRFSLTYIAVRCSLSV